MLLQVRLQQLPVAKLVLSPRHLKWGSRCGGLVMLCILGVSILCVFWILVMCTLGVIIVCILDGSVCILDGTLCILDASMGMQLC